MRLALMHGPGHLSRRTTAALAGDGAIVALSDKGVLGRLRKMGDWLEHLLQRLLAQQRGLACADRALDLALVDGSVVSTGWRRWTPPWPGPGCWRS